MKTKLLPCLFLLTVVGFSVPALSQTIEKQAAIKITGEITTPLNLALADLQKLPIALVSRKDRDGKDHQYSGVLLSDILLKAGATLGADLKGEHLTKFVLAEASDGYQVVFALAELDKGFTDRAVIVATQMDGADLPAGDGPFRIIVQDEKKPARCLKQLTGLKIAFAK